MKSNKLNSFTKYTLLTISIICVCLISKIFFGAYPDNLIPFNITLFVCLIVIIRKKLHRVFFALVCSSFVGANNLLSWTRDKKLLTEEIPSVFKRIFTIISTWFHSSNIISSFISENIIFFALPLVTCVICGTLFYFIEKTKKKRTFTTNQPYSSPQAPSQNETNISSKENNIMNLDKTNVHQQTSSQNETNVSGNGNNNINSGGINIHQQINNDDEPNSKSDKKILAEISFFIGLTLFILFCVIESLFYIKKNQVLPFSLKDSFIAVSNICIPSLIFIFGFLCVVCAIMISVYIILSMGRKIIDAIKHSNGFRISELFDKFGFSLCLIMSLFIVLSITADDTFMKDVPYLYNVVKFIRSIITVSFNGDGEGYSSLAQTAGMGIILVLTVLVLALLIYIAMMIFLALLRDRTQLLKTEIEVYSTTIALQCANGIKNLFKFVVDTVCGVIGTLRFLPSFIKSFNNLLTYEDGDEMISNISEKNIREKIKEDKNGDNNND